MKTARRGRDEARRERECQEGARDLAAAILLLRLLLLRYSFIAGSHFAALGVFEPVFAKALEKYALFFVVVGCEEVDVVLFKPPA